jgi:hypothetical protein
MQKAVILNTCRIVRKFLATVLGQRDQYPSENQLNCCEVQNVDDDDDDGDDDDNDNDPYTPQ